MIFLARNHLLKKVDNNKKKRPILELRRGKTITKEEVMIGAGEDTVVAIHGPLYTAIARQCFKGKLDRKRVVSCLSDMTAKITDNYSKDEDDRTPLAKSCYGLAYWGDQFDRITPDACTMSLNLIRREINKASARGLRQTATFFAKDIDRELPKNLAGNYGDDGGQSVNMTFTDGIAVSAEFCYR